VKEGEMMIEMKVAGLTIDPFTNMPIIILKDLAERNAVPIWIGLVEASAIATELEKIQLSRPMTHDLLKNVLDTLGVQVTKVEVNDLRENTFFASIFLAREGGILEIDSRPSDAIALALRTGATIYIAQHVIEKARKVDLQEREKQVGRPLTEEEKEKWSEVLENLPPEQFGKYKM
jgi:bifunctional DNase/RNase